MVKVLLLCLLYLGWTMTVNAAMKTNDNALTQTKFDSLSLVDWPLIAVPTLNYSPESSWSFGAAASWFFKIKEAPQTSEVSMQGEYTLKHQYGVHLQTTLYFSEKKKWLFSGNVGYRYYPNWFYGVGNQFDDLLKQPLGYTSRRFYLMGQPLYRFPSGWMVGPALQVRYEGMNRSNEIDSVAALIKVPGFTSYWMVGIGGVVSYDNRQPLYYPLQGLFFKTRLYYYEPYLGSSYRVGWCDVDFRQYIPIYKEFIFAWQLLAAAQIGKDMPFQMMPTFGGIDIMRGIRNGVWRDDLMWALQGEFRVPIWRFIKGAVFAGVGDVYSWNQKTTSWPKISYGAGLRLSLLKPSVHLRFDVARNNYNNDWMFYFTVKEAF